MRGYWLLLLGLNMVSRALASNGVCILVGMDTVQDLEVIRDRGVE